MGLFHLQCGLGVIRKNVLLGIIELLATVRQMITEITTVHHLIASPESSFYESFIGCSWLYEQQKKQEDNVMCVCVQGAACSALCLSRAGWEASACCVCTHTKETLCFGVVFFFLKWNNQAFQGKRQQASKSRPWM